MVISSDQVYQKKQSHFLRNKYPPDFDINKFLKFIYKIRKSVGDDFNLMVDFGCRIKSIKQFKYFSDYMFELKFFYGRANEKKYKII